MNWIDAIKKYVPYNEQEIKEKEIIMDAIEKYDNLLARENKAMHITCSGYVINKARDKVLMIYHKIDKSWAWTGGHADGAENLLNVAIKEVKEETGLRGITPLTNDIFSLEVLTVDGHYKNGEFVGSHLHLNVTYLFEADERDKLIVNEEETKGVKWLPIDELSTYCSEPYMIENIYKKLNSKIRELK